MTGGNCRSRPGAGETAGGWSSVSGFGGRLPWIADVLLLVGTKNGPAYEANPCLQ